MTSPSNRIIHAGRLLSWARPDNHLRTRTDQATGIPEFEIATPGKKAPHCSTTDNRQVIMQRLTSIVDLIRQLEVPLFGTMDAADLAAIVPLFHRRNFAPNQLVFSKGDRAGDLYILLSGRMKISILAPDGRELAFRTAGPGQMVGEIAVLDGGTRTADMTALAQSEVLVLSKASLTRLIADRPAISRDLIQFLCQRLRDTTEQLESIALYRIEARLARFLLALSDQIPSTSKTVEVPLVLSQTELGAVLGASRSKVNVALHHLEEVGAIRRHGSRLTCDVEKLLVITEDIP